jgi:hypothetical protein
MLVYRIWKILLKIEMQFNPNVPPLIKGSALEIITLMNLAMIVLEVIQILVSLFIEDRIA